MRSKEREREQEDRNGVKEREIEGEGYSNSETWSEGATRERRCPWLDREADRLCSNSSSSGGERRAAI